MSSEVFAAARKSCSAWAMVPGCWPPSESVVTVIMRVWSLPTFCGAGRWCGTTPTSRSTASRRTDRRARPARRRAAASARATGSSSSRARRCAAGSPSSPQEPKYVEAGLRAVDLEGTGSRRRRDARGVVPRALPEARQAARGRQRDRLARAVVVGGRRQGDDAAPARGDRRGARRRAVRPLPAEHNELLREELGLPADVYVVGVVTIGHAAPDDGRGSSRRKFPWLPLEEVVRWEHW